MHEPDDSRKRTFDRYFTNIQMLFFNRPFMAFEHGADGSALDNQRVFAGERRIYLSAETYDGEGSADPSCRCFAVKIRDPYISLIFKYFY